MTYAEKLKDPRWQKKRLEILSRDNFTCSNCGDTELTLHVHHVVYFKGDEPWEATNDTLDTLCSDCHKIQHLKFSELERFLYECSLSRMRDCKTSIRISFRKIVIELHSKGRV